MWKITKCYTCKYVVIWFKLSTLVFILSLWFVFKLASRSLLSLISSLIVIQIFIFILLPKLMSYKILLLELHTCNINRIGRWSCLRSCYLRSLGWSLPTWPAGRSHYNSDRGGLNYSPECQSAKCWWNVWTVWCQ